MSLNGAMSWLGNDKIWRDILPRNATEVRITDPIVGPEACKLGKCYTMRERNSQSRDNLDEILSQLDNIDVQKLVDAFEELPDKNFSAYWTVLRTPQMFLENVGVRRAVLIVKAMKKHILPLYEKADILNDTESLESISNYYLLLVDEEVILKRINVGTTPWAVCERLQKIKSPTGIVTDRSLEVTTAAEISTTLTLALVVASSIQIQVLNNNGIDITFLWSLWTIILALCLNLFIATVTTDWNWYYFLRLKSLEKSIGSRHLKMLNCCKHDLLHALNEGYLKDTIQVVNEDTSFILNNFRGGDIALNLSYNIEDLELSCSNIWNHYTGGYKMKETEECKTFSTNRHRRQYGTF